MVYQLLLKDGTKSGNYNINSSPGQTAKKMAKVIYEDGGMKGKETFDFQFVKNRVQSLGGDRYYQFRATVMPLPKSRENWVETPSGGFFKKFHIQVKNLLRN